MRGPLLVSMFLITLLLIKRLLPVDDSIFMRSTGAQPESGESLAGNVGGGRRASQRFGTMISMCTSSSFNSTQLRRITW